MIQPVVQLPGLWQEERFEARPDWDGAAIRYNNRAVAHMQRIAVAALHRACLMPMPVEELEVDMAHEYGPAPLHYRRRGFERSCALVRACPGLAFSLPPDADARGRLIEAEMAEWRSLALGASA